MSRLRQYLANWSSLSPEKYKSIADKYKVISFDIFDTLLKRNVSEPKDIFLATGIVCKHQMQDFKELRIAAEARAREKKPSGEVTLDEIYNELPGTDEVRRQYKDAEIQCELQLSTRNPDLSGFYDYCVKTKTVVLTSDMYLPRSVIEELLDRNGISGYRKLYISCEVDKSKSRGDLFDYVCSDLNVRRSDMLHIGNAFKADYLTPKKKKIASIKTPTSMNRMQRLYQNSMDADGFKYSVMNAFINNYTPVRKDQYFQFGYEVFGPLLYGFVNNMYHDAKEKGIRQIMFLSRDGYIMKKLYERLGYDISDIYLEVSRRSLRVPNYHKGMTYEDMVSSLTVPNMTNVVEIFDSFGLNANDYQEIIRAAGYAFDEQIKRDNLKDDSRFKGVYDQVSEAIFSNAEKERVDFLKYINGFDFTIPTAIVDIGWGGSMQMYLTKTLNQLGIKPDISGYYVGLTLKARENLGKNNLEGYGYGFDCLNRDDPELESSYIGLIESMFLEQSGSVKRYESYGETTKAVRYPYEYLTNSGLMPEAKAVDSIQNGALAFAKDFHNTLADSIIGNDYRVMYCHMHDVGDLPTTLNIKEFGRFKFFNCGNEVYLSNPKPLLHYLHDIKGLKHDIYDCQWKMGFLKALFKLPISYEKLFAILRKAAN